MDRSEAEGKVMNEDVRDFLRKFRLGELTERGILRGEIPWLRGLSVPPLMALMKEHGVPRLVAQERNWYLTSDGEFSNPGSKDILQGHYENLERHGNVFRKQNRHINPHWTGSLAYRSSDKDDDEDGDDDGGLLQSSSFTDPPGASFGLERDLQRALRTNIVQLEPGLIITDGGSEKTVAAGRIDITAEDDQGNLVVIELKAGAAEPEAIAQLLAYMGTIENPRGTLVRGILVAYDFTPRVVQAAKAVPGISLKAYSLQFNFQDR